MNRIQALYEQGQSIWFDYIERSMVQTGEMQRLVDMGITGVTSNPTIFEQAITTSDAYQEELQQLVTMDQSAKDIYETLAIADIQAAADILFPVYERANRQDGHVSIEVAPDLADDTEATIAEARRLFASVNRPNVMVKVPATEAGIPAIRQLISDGISINVTLIFGLGRYAAVKEAYLQGLEDRVQQGEAIDQIASVASFFISRVDSNVDGQLQALGKSALMGKAAIANAKLAYAQFQEKFSGERWGRLAAQNAQLQRPLWASTSTKNPDYPDVLYVDTLIGPHTVNTMPPKTFDAFQARGTVARTIDQDVGEAATTIATLAEMGIAMEDIAVVLEEEGVEKFADSYTQLLAAIEKRRTELAA